MASEVDICNLALANLGDDATVASINPPEGSAQAEHCARFYPMARDMLLQSHNWSFACARVLGAELTSQASSWQYAYAVPADAIRVIAVMPNDATDDLAYLPLGTQNLPVGWYTSQSAYTPQKFTVERLADGTRVVYTNQENAVIRYLAQVNDTTVYPPMFVTAISWQLSSMIAGPLLKGDMGATESKRCAGIAQQFLTMAKASDANQGHQPNEHIVPWVSGR